MPLVAAANRHNAAYLRTKQQRSGHLLAMTDVQPRIMVAANGRDLRTASGG
jgi:hypothetical protein